MRLLLSKLPRQLTRQTLFTAATVAGYGWLAWLMPLFPHQTQLRGLRFFTPSLTEGVRYGVWLIALYWLYWAMAEAVRHGRWQLGWGTMAKLMALFALPLWFTYPFNAGDIFRYAFSGRISTLYGANPYLTPLSAYPQDAFASLTGEWADFVTPYGPLWELVVAAVAWVADGSIGLHLLLLKGVSTAAHLAIGWLIWHTTADRWRTVLWLFNPALLLTFVANGHNDSLMLLWLVWGGVVSQKRPLLGFALLCLAPLTKAIGILPLPLFVLAHLRLLPTWGARLKWVGAYTAVGLALAALLFAPFGSPWALALRLANEAGAGASFSLGALFLLVASEDWSWRITAGLMTILVAVGLGVLAMVGVGVSWRVWHGRSPWWATAILLAAYLVQALNFRLWYATWVWPFSLLEEPYPTQWRFGFYFLLCTQLSAVVYTHVWYYQLGRDHVQTHWLGVALTFLVPFILSRRRG
ncbi:MAG: hypothetical protein IPL28_00085 [Chloroflexi bacterium]|nr:hypothetical protein [Chloroflexota bacterium]